MNPKKSLPLVYVATSLTDVKNIADRNTIRSFRASIDPICKLCPWAFNLETWTPGGGVSNVYLYDTNGLDLAHLVIGLYLTSAGSDGRGAEIARRAEQRKPLIVFAISGVRISRYITDCLQTFGHPEVETFKSDAELICRAKEQIVKI